MLFGFMIESTTRYDWEFTVEFGAFFGGNV